MKNEEFRGEVAKEAFAALLGNPHFSKHHLKALHERDILQKDNAFFKVLASHACHAADELISELDRTARKDRSAPLTRVS
jgi:predicted ATPase